MPQWLQSWIGCARHLSLFWLNADNVYWYAEVLIDKYTDLCARNPNLNTNFAKERCQLILIIDAHVRTLFFISNTWPNQVFVSMALVMYVTFSVAHGRFSNYRGRFIFAGIMLVAFVAHLISLALMLPAKTEPLETPRMKADFRKRHQIRRRNRAKLGNTGPEESVVKALYFCL
jgi:hypothetical protein